MVDFIFIPDNTTYDILSTYQKRRSNFLPGYDVLSFTRTDVHPAYCRRTFHRRVTTQYARVQSNPV